MKKKQLNEENFKTICIDEGKYKTLLSKKYLNRKTWKINDPTLIVSVIPGTIFKVFVSEGDKVEEGDKLLILEAMKMKNIITIPYSGIIKKIHVSEGQSIPKNHLMAELEIKIHKKE
jgi:biotin carboxyl carrier protein